MLSPIILDSINQLITEYSLFNESLPIQKSNIIYAISVLNIVRLNPALPIEQIQVLLELVKYLIELNN